MPAFSAAASPSPVPKLNGLGYLFVPAGARKVVLVSHGSQGIDSRMLDYVDYVRSGESKPSSDANVQAMMKDCRGKGFHTGHAGDRFIGVPHWIGFFKKHL
ncbi:MAG: hypothetical protein ABI460_03955 [Caldimonas sp.]